MKPTIVTVQDVEWRVEGDFEPAEAETRDSPAWPALFSASAIYINGSDIDIMELLDAAVRSEVENTVLEVLSEPAERPEL